VFRGQPAGDPYVTILPPLPESKLELGGTGIPFQIQAHQTPLHDLTSFCTLDCIKTGDGVRFDSVVSPASTRLRLVPARGLAVYGCGMAVRMSVDHEVTYADILVRVEFSVAGEIGRRYASRVFKTEDRRRWEALV
jgi:hypothetical protein